MEHSYAIYYNGTLCDYPISRIAYFQQARGFFSIEHSK